MLSVSMNKSTRVVTSVPSDALDYYMAWDCLKEKPKFRTKYGVKDGWVISIVPVIEVPQFGNMFWWHVWI